MGEMLVTFFHLLTSFSRLLNLRQILVFLLEKAFLKMAKKSSSHFKFARPHLFFSLLEVLCTLYI